MSSYSKETLLRAEQIIAAKDAMQALMEGPAGIMLDSKAFNDLVRAYGHLCVRYKNARELVIEAAIDKEKGEGP